ncbi:hypothetical protein [Micromonospora matsumotoense]|uniref:hypothetical protein n=1 Tax=Micromonospora matsumotoense TaxID=121616 RepID=UPI0033C94C8B
MNARPRPGDLLIVDRAASVQFAGERALRLRVVSVCDRPTYDGWIWLTGYVLDRHDRATARREVFVQLAGLRHAASPPGSAVQAGRRAVATPVPTTGTGRRAAGPPSTAGRSGAAPLGSDRR